ncbi:MAG TPA: ATP-dependent zinc metalloprotease FtsH, partial [Thermoflexales bacterium]|nr:ATP-dependent zinc metalloprotease FtsH [Thermoflexales bacterium]
MNRGAQINLWYVLFALMGIVLLRDIWVQTQAIEAIPYSQFETYLDQGAIESVTIGSTTISGKFKTPQDGKTGFVTTPVSPALAERLGHTGVTYSGAVENTWFTTLLSWILPALIFVGIWMFLIRRMGAAQGMGGLTSIGKSKAKVYVESDTKVTFADVAGVDEAKAELQEVIDFLKNPKEYGSLGARMPKGILLVGPPGTGKTLLARAVAGEASVPFFSISGSEFVEMFVGVGAARVRDLFEQARKAAPAIIFIDELDALGRARGAGMMQGGNDEREQTLNQLLSELDGFDPGQGVVLLSATNRPEILDPALLRAGRFDRQVLVDRPDRAGRVQILKVHMKKIVLGPDMGVDDIAALTTGFSGADLANLVNEAALLATRRRGKVVSMDDFTHAIERIVAGLEKRNRLINPRERRIVAYHEMGHALVSMALPGGDAVHKVSIIPRGIGALGYTIQRPTEDRFLMTESELRDKIAVLMGGRAAEQLVFGHLSTGASDDLARATDIARSMVARYGMDADLGGVSYETERSSFLGDRPPGYLERNYSEATAEAMD